MSLSSDPIVILGTFRSGTSALATCFSHLGVYFGQEKDFQPADEFNPGGYWELRDMQLLNAKILTVFGTNYYQIDRLPEDWQSQPGSAMVVNEIRGLLRGKFNGQGRWGWKEPATSILLPLYKQAMADEGITAPRYPISVRHPLSVAASQNKRQSQWGFKDAKATGAEGVAAVEERTVGLWVQYTLSALRESKGSVRQVICYENFLKDPRPYLEWITQGLEWHPSAEQMDAAVASVKPEWSHSRYTADDLKPWSSVVVRTYDLCQRADKDPQGLTDGKFDAEIDGLWEEWMDWSKMIRPILLPAGQMIFTWRQNGQQAGHAERFSPTGTWQTVSLDLPIQPGSEVFIDPYQMPCQVWIRKATWRVGDNERRAILGPGPSGIIEDAFGIKKLTSFGPGSLVGQIPPGNGPVTFEMELMVRSGQEILTEMISTLRGRLDQARRGGQSQQFPGARRR
jgi:hypothetical protein